MLGYEVTMLGYIGDANHYECIPCSRKVRIFLFMNMHMNDAIFTVVTPLVNTEEKKGSFIYKYKRIVIYIAHFSI